MQQLSQRAQSSCQILVVEKTYDYPRSFLSDPANKACSQEEFTLRQAKEG